MMLTVLGRRHDGKVPDVVIVLIAVDVMNMLLFLQKAPELVLDQDPV